MMYYTINKGTDKTVEIKGLRAQHLTHMVVVVIGLFFLFIFFRLVGIPDSLSIVTLLALGGFAIGYILRMNKKYGRYGLSKLQAARAIPTYILRRKTFGTLHHQ